MNSLYMIIAWDIKEIKMSFLIVMTLTVGLWIIRKPAASTWQPIYLLLLRPCSTFSTFCSVFSSIESPFPSLFSANPFALNCRIAFLSTCPVICSMHPYFFSSSLFILEVLWSFSSIFHSTRCHYVFNCSFYLSLKHYVNFILVNSLVFLSRLPDWLALLLCHYYFYLVFILIFGVLISSWATTV